MSLYRSLIRQSFIIAWQHKYLWFFGLFATLLASNFEIELINRFTSREATTIYDWQRWADTGLFSPATWSNLGNILRNDTGSFISMLVLLLVLLALILALLWLSVVSQGGLVYNAHKASLDGSRKLSVAEKKHDTAIGFREGRKRFWPILFLHVVVRLIVYLLALVTIAPIIVVAKMSVTLSLLYFIVFIVLVALALVLAFVAKYAIAFIVLKGKPLGSAIMAAWNLFRTNWLISIEMTLMLFALSIVASFAIIIGVMIMAIPIALLYILSLVFGSFILFVIVLILGILISIAIVVLGGSIITVVQTTAWVGLFEQLISGKKPQSRLQRTFDNIM